MFLFEWRRAVGGDGDNVVSIEWRRAAVGAGDNEVAPVRSVGDAALSPWLTDVV